MFKPGKALVTSGKGDTAFTLVKKTMAKRSSDPLLNAACREILAYKFQGFHSVMLRDCARNEAYSKPLEAVVAGKRVLDIGTGFGLLAMMSARAGAAHVYAREAEPMLAATAREIVSANSLADKITVFAKHSDDLDLGRDLGGGAQVVVSEIFSQSLLGEAVLPSLNHARKHLCAPDAMFLPQRAVIRVAFADWTKPFTQISTVEGFDLSLFDRHVHPTRSVERHDKDIKLRSDGVDLFEFDFANAPKPFERTSLSPRSTGGRVNAIVQWIRIEMVNGIVYENEPSLEGKSHWALVLTPMAKARETVVGEMVEIGGWRDEMTVLALAEGAEDGRSQFSQQQNAFG